MFCPNCGAGLPDDSIFCEKCGCRVEAGPAQPQESVRGAAMPAGKPLPLRPSYVDRPSANESARRRASRTVPEPVKSTRPGGVKYAVFGLAAVLLIGAGILLLGKGGTDGNGSKPPQAAAESATRALTSGEGPVPVSGEETSGGTAPTPGGMAAIADRLSTTEHAGVLNFESALDSAHYGGETAGRPSDDVPQTVTLDDFDWYAYDGFPTDGTVLHELQDLGGRWKSLIHVVTTVDGVKQGRLMLSDMEIQYMGYKVTMLMHVKGCYEYPAHDPDSVEILETADNLITAFNGDWDEEPGTIEVFSESSAMALQLRDFVDSGGVQYAIGSVFSDDGEIGEIVMVREIQQ